MAANACARAVILATVLTLVIAGRPFRQYNATIFQNHGAPPTAQWGYLPFSSSVVAAAYSPSDASYLVLTAAGELWLVGPTGSSFRRVQSFSAGARMATSENPFVAVVVDNTGITRCNATSCGLPHPINGRLGRVASVSLQFVPHDPSPLIMVASNTGLWAYNTTTRQSNAVALTNTLGNVTTDLNVTLVFCLPSSAGDVQETDFFGGRCFAAVNDAWCHLEYNQCANTVHAVRGVVETLMLRTPGIIDRRPLAATYDPLRRAVVFVQRICINVLHANGSLHRIEGGVGGLPQHNLTSASTAGNGQVWLGSLFGAMSREFDGSWRYYFGPRWLPGTGFTDGMRVSAIAASNSETLVATDGGISFLTVVEWTLREKAALFESHISPRHDFFGICTSIPSAKFGDVSSWYQECNANSGLWSSMYLASQSYRFATEGTAAAKASAWRVFSGMELLVNATGVKGYPARCVSLHNKTGQGGWHQSATMKGFWFLGTTSSDEITGHLNAYPLMHDLVASSPEERARVLRLIRDITDNIVDNGLQLVGASGKATQWGKWDPKTNVNDPNWYDETGLSAMEIVAYLSSAYRLTGNETYAVVARRLMDKHRYAQYIVNLKITQMMDVNYSDDELTFLAYLTFLWSCRPSTLMQTNKICEWYRPYVELSIQRTWEYVRVERPSLWSVIYAAYNVASNRSVGEETAFAEWALQTWPISGVDWPTNNGNRLDVEMKPSVPQRMHYRKHIKQTLRLDEITCSYLNCDPFTVGQGSGYNDYDQGAWLFPYWMARYYRFLG